MTQKLNFNVNSFVANSNWVSTYITEHNVKLVPASFSKHYLSLECREVFM